MKIEIFKSGKHRTALGQKIEFSQDDILDVAQNYNPENHEAPLTIAHPKDNSPAFGWVKGLSTQKQGKQTSLYAEIEPTPNFTEALENKHYKKVSAAFYGPDDGANPNPGAWSLRHVGALGAMPPAVKGLQAFNFNDDGQYVEFLEWGNPFKPLIEVLQSLREYFIAGDDVEAADRIIPQWKIDSIEEAADPHKKESLLSDFSEGDDLKPLKKKEDENMNKEFEALKKETEKELAELKDQHAKIVAENEALKAEFAEEKAQGTAKALVDKAISEGKISPAQSAGLVEFMAGLPGGDENTIEFSEGEKTIKSSPLEFMEGFLNRLPKQVEFAEITAFEGEAEFSETELAAKAAAYQASQAANGIGISFSEAVVAITKGAK